MQDIFFNSIIRVFASHVALSYHFKSPETLASICITLAPEPIHKGTVQI